MHQQSSLRRSKRRVPLCLVLQSPSMRHRRRVQMRAVLSPAPPHPPLPLLWPRRSRYDAVPVWLTFVVSAFLFLNRVHSNVDAIDVRTAARNRRRRRRRDLARLSARPRSSSRAPLRCAFPSTRSTSATVCTLPTASWRTTTRRMSSGAAAPRTRCASSRTTRRRASGACPSTFPTMRPQTSAASRRLLATPRRRACPKARACGAGTRTASLSRAGARRPCAPRAYRWRRSTRRVPLPPRNRCNRCVLMRSDMCAARRPCFSFRFSLSWLSVQT